MDKHLACHSIALEAAKHNADPNMTDNTNFNFDEYVSDMTPRVKIGSTSVKLSN